MLAVIPGRQPHDSRITRRVGMRTSLLTTDSPLMAFNSNPTA